MSELREILNIDDRHGDLEVKIILDIPSMGGYAYTTAKDAHFGFDWDKGLMIRTTEPIALKEDKQSIFESATDLLMMLATECFILKKEKYENRKSKEILLKFGYTEEQLRKYVKLYHRDKELIK